MTVVPMQKKSRTTPKFGEVIVWLHPSPLPGKVRFGACLRGLSGRVIEGTLLYLSACNSETWVKLKRLAKDKHSLPCKITSRGDIEKTSLDENDPVVKALRHMAGQDFFGRTVIPVQFWDAADLSVNLKGSFGAVPYTQKPRTASTVAEDAEQVSMVFEEPADVSVSKVEACVFSKMLDKILEQKGADFILDWLAERG